MIYKVTSKITMNKFKEMEEMGQYNLNTFNKLYEILSEPELEHENEDIEFYKNKVYAALAIVAEILDKGGNK